MKSPGMCLTSPLQLREMCGLADSFKRVNATESSRSTPRSDHNLHTLALARNVLIGLQVDALLLIDGLLYSQSAKFSVEKPLRQWADPCMAQHSSTMQCMRLKDERFINCKATHTKCLSSSNVPDS